MDIKVGDKFKLYFGESWNPNNVNLMRIMAVIEEEKVVYKFWSYKRKWWRYRLVDLGLLELYYEDGTLTRR